MRKVAKPRGVRSFTTSLRDAASASTTPCTSTDALRALQADPELSRTLMVATKLDRRIGSWNTAADAESFLNPPADVFGCGTLLGGSPFFTSVPPRPDAAGADAEHGCASPQHLAHARGTWPTRCLWLFCAALPIGVAKPRWHLQSRSLCEANRRSDRRGSRGDRGQARPFTARRRARAH